MKMVHKVDGGEGEGNIPETGKVTHKAHRSKQQHMFGKLESSEILKLTQAETRQEERTR